MMQDYYKKAEKRIQRFVKKSKVKLCPDCHGEYVIKHGFNVTRKGKLQRYKCQECGCTFQ